MEYTKDELYDAILDVAKSLNIKKSYKILIDEHINTPSLVKMIVYDMFVYEFDYTSCSPKLYTSYNIILEYTKELQCIGYVNFK